MFTTDNTSINTINNDCLRQIFSFLSVKDIVTCGHINQKWRKVTRDSRFLNIVFPILKSDAAPLLTSNGFVALANAYRQTEFVQDLKKLSLKKCLAMTDSALKSLNIRTTSLSIKDCPITANGISNVLSNLISPARIRIAQGTSIKLCDIFKECIVQKIRLQKLDLRKASSQQLEEDSQLVYSLNRRDFALLLGKNLLQSPCHLDIRKELWVNNQVINALQSTQSVAFSFLGITLPKTPYSTRGDRYCNILSSLNFTRPCEIRSNFKLNNQMLKLIIAKNLLLKSLKLDDDIDSNLLTTIFQSHLFSPCRMKLQSNIFTHKLVEILIKQNITIDYLHLKDDLPVFSADNLLALSTLFQQVPIKDLRIECEIIIPSNLDNFVKCLSHLKHNANPPSSITIRNFNGFNKTHFLSLSNAGIFKGKGLSLTLEGEWIDTNVIESLATVKDLTFKKFQMLGNWRYYHLTSLMEKNSFKQCESFLPGYGGLASGSLCPLFSSETSINKLHISLSSSAWRERTSQFLLDPKCFINLTTLTVSDINDKDFKDFAIEILRVRPNLLLRHISNNQPTIEEALEVD